MKILHITSTDIVGGRFNGYAMLRAGVPPDCQVAMAVWGKESSHPDVHDMRRGWLRYANAILGRASEGLALEGLITPASLFLPWQACVRQADVVHLHLIHNRSFFSLLGLPQLSHFRPTVWTIHDSWPTSGMCIYPFECERWLTGCQGRCPHPRGRSWLRRYVPALHWRVKQSVYRQAHLTLVVASEWMCERVQRSPLLGHLPCQLIPFGVDLATFAPRPKPAARVRLGIPAGDHVLAFRAPEMVKDHFKGTRWLLEALTTYEPAKPTTLLILEDGRDFEPLTGKYRIVNLGWVRDDDRMADIMSAADLFLMPSVQEAFGLMAVEAMACGAPVIVFDGTALPSVIQAPEGGFVVKQRDSAALAAAVRRFLEDDDLRETTAAAARRLAEREYSFDLYLQRHMDLYSRVIEAFGQRKSQRE
jgi:glycosyltransferase involved in cell wall biosynthesis